MGHSPEEQVQEGTLFPTPKSCLNLGTPKKWVWVKIEPPGDRRFWSMFPFTRIPFGVHMLDSQSNPN